MAAPKDGEWNFHGLISLPLENQVKKLKTDITADEIDHGFFVKVMLAILTLTGKSNPAFEEQCKPYDGKTKMEISEEEARKLYSKFEALMKEETRS